MPGKPKKRVGTRGTSYQMTVELPRHPVTGKRRQKLLTAPTKREVEALAFEMLVALGNGGFAEADAQKITVETYLTRWLQANAETVRATTQQRYADLIRLHVIPFIGTKLLGKLTPLDVQGLYTDRMTTGKLSPTTVQQIHNILHKALKQAMRWGLLTRNVTEAIEPPKRVSTEMKVWSRDQAAAFLAVADKHELAALWRLALLTGMRRGEILGLKWEDLDLTTGTLAVRRTCIRGTGGNFEFNQPKTAKSRRQISLTRSTVEGLQRHRKRQVEASMKIRDVYNDLDLVFAAADGNPLHPNSLALQFNRLIAQACVPRIRFHDLRHTSATLMLANGEHPKIVAERLGHSDIGMTMNRYSHVTMDMQRQAADRLDDLMEGA